MRINHELKNSRSGKNVFSFQVCYKDVTFSGPPWPSSILASVLYLLGLSPSPALVSPEDTARILSGSSEDENDPTEWPSGTVS